MRRSFFLGLFCASVFFGCASFSFERFGLDLVNQKLLHYESSAKDKALEECSNADGKFKCVVLFSDEFYRLKADYERVVAQLKECQSGQ